MGRSGSGPGPSLLTVGSVAELTTTLQEAGVATGRPVVVLVGGAGGMTEHEVDVLANVLAHSVFPVLGAGGVVVDGGTEAGVMSAAGRARMTAHGAPQLVGVAATGTVRVPEGSSAASDAAHLDPGHTHVVMVPGKRWGDESPWLGLVAAAIAARGPSATVLANGGAIAAHDVTGSLVSGRPVVVLAGSGRLADDVASLRSDHDENRPGDAARIARAELTTIVDMHDLDAVREAVSTALSRSSEGA